MSKHAIASSTSLRPRKQFWRRRSNDYSETAASRWQRDDAPVQSQDGLLASRNYEARHPGRCCEVAASLRGDGTRMEKARDGWGQATPAGRMRMFRVAKCAVAPAAASLMRALASPHNGTAAQRLGGRANSIETVGSVLECSRCVDGVASETAASRPHHDDSFAQSQKRFCAAIANSVCPPP